MGQNQNTVRRSLQYAWVILDLNKSYDFNRFKVSAYPHYGAYNEAMQLLKKRGWSVTKDPRIEKDYKILSKYHRYARKGDLECEIEIYANGCKFEFYQNINFTHPSGGKYEFDKYKVMPYLIKKSFLLESQKLLTHFERRFKAVVKYSDSPVNPQDRIIDHCQTRSFFKNKIVSLDEMESLMTDYDHCQNSWDRDNKLIKCGETKYFRDYNGYIQRGTVYHNINNMWWVITGPYSLTNIASFRLFDATAEDLSNRRSKEKRIPEKVKSKYKSLAEMSESDLVKELARRKKGVGSPVPTEA